jgi:sugar O-acyltransferase (sialic acid O-acetyltransferase NeuD family)
MKDLIVIGSGGHARTIIDTAKLNSLLNITGVLDIHFKENIKEKILGVPILGGMQYLEKISPDHTVVFLAVGDNKIRKTLSTVIDEHGFKSINIAHPKAYISEYATLGNGNFVGAFANIGPNSRIANYCIVNTLATIEHEVRISDFCQFGPGSIVCGRSSIDENVFIGAGSKVIDNISISTGVTIGAGAVVIKNITEHNTKYAGVPARKI